MKTYVALVIVLLALSAVGCGNKIRTGLDYQLISQVQQER